MSRGPGFAVIALGAIVLAAPLGAQDTPVVAAPAAVAATPVDSFYAARAEASLWLKDEAGRSAAAKLAAILRNAQLDGVSNASELAGSVEAAIARGQPADDKIISAAWVRMVQVLSGPVKGVSFGDPALAPKAPSPAEILAEAANAPSLAAHVETVAAVNPLYSALREAAVKQGSAGDPRVAATLERLRLIPAKGRAIVVDVAGARMSTLEDGRVVDTMKVIVGTKKTPTPLLAGTIHYVTFNPYWNIPHDVASARVAPLVIKRGVSYLKAARYVTADGFGRKAQLVEAAEIDWKAVAAGDAPVHLRQLPGPNNMMGAMKFGFENDFDIFLHDTPRRKLFDKEQRTLSMGCIRLEHAERFARWLLRRDPTPPSDEPEQHVAVEGGVPVYVTYLTANVEEGQLAFANDVYGLDPAPAALASAEAPQSLSKSAEAGQSLSKSAER